MERYYRRKIFFGSTILLSLFLLGSSAFSQEDSFEAFEKEFGQLIQSSQRYVVTVIAQAKRANPLAIYDTTQSGASSPIIVNKKVGSGFIVDSDGIIITRRSVIENMNDIFVVLHNGDGFSGEILGIDDRYNVAYLKVDQLSFQENPRFSQLNSEEIGNWVLVIGNSLGYYPPISMGLVKETLDNGIIQIGAKIWPGSVGSPVFNLKGQVIGILAARVTSKYSNQLKGMIEEEEGMVIPMGHILPRIKQIVEETTSGVAWVGMSVSPYPSNSGTPLFKVTQIYPDSPAEASDIRLGDQLLSVDSQPIRDLKKLAKKIRDLSVNDVVTFEIKRGDNEFRKEIQVGKRPPAYASRIPQTPDVDSQIKYRFEKIGASQVDRLMLQQRINQLEGQIQSLRKLLNRNQR